MSRTKEYLEHRQREIEQILGPLQHEQAEIRLALKAIQGSLGRSVPDVGPKGNKRKKLSINALTQDVLRAHPEGLRTAQVAELLASEHRRVVARSNVSWYLSTLKREGKAVLEDELWKPS